VGRNFAKCLLPKLCEEGGRGAGGYFSTLCLVKTIQLLVFFLKLKFTF
jgi:hypothetical protein